MGYATGEDADSLELGSMPPLPRPRAHPAAASPLSAVSTRSSATSRPSPRDTVHKDDDDEDLEAVAPPPVPHAHPLQGWKPQARNGATTRNGSDARAVMEHLQRPLRPRQVHVERLHPAFLSRERVIALANTESVMASAPTGREMVSHSIRALENRISQVELLQVEPQPLGEEELRFAATDAAQLRQLGYDRMDLQNQHLIAAAAQIPSGPQDSALERARQRKVKKQVDARWLEKRNDPTLRPVGPLEREDERDFYDSVYEVSMQELLDEGILFDAQDRKAALAISPVEWDDLAVEKRGTTGLPGSCFDVWSFN